MVAALWQASSGSFSQAFMGSCKLSVLDALSAFSLSVHQVPLQRPASLTVELGEQEGTQGARRHVCLCAIVVATNYCQPFSVCILW
jgi:hypothetical protein